MIKLNRPPCPYPKALADRNYKHERNKSALIASTNGKCMYCEAKISHVNYGHVEHIKPKAAQYFPHLEFDWDNLGYVCDKCNVAKGSKYFAGCEFINPYAEEPSDSLRPYGTFIFGNALSERAELTINELQLNRADLIERRDERIKSIHRAYLAAQRFENDAVRNSALDELKKEAMPDKEFSLVISAFLRHLGVLV